MQPQHTSHSPLAPLGARIRIFGRVLQSFAIGRRKLPRSGHGQLYLFGTIADNLRALVGSLSACIDNCQ
eukprot:3417251-Pleurochrysis_carterae.AAC.1